MDVATNNTENLDKLKTSAPEKLKELKVIWKSPLIPGDPIVWRKNLSETTKDKIYDFFMNYGKTPEEKRCWNAWAGRHSALPATCNWCRFASSRCLKRCRA